MAIPIAAKRAIPPCNPTLLPFLYQTRTILGHASRRSRIPLAYQQLHASSRRQLGSSRRCYASTSSQQTDYDIPFEDEEPVAFHKQRKSTITESERRTFEKLYQDYSSSRGKDLGLDRVSDEDLGTTEDTLDSILNNVLLKDTAEDSGEDPFRTASALRDRAPGTRRAVAKQTRLSTVAEEQEATPVKRAQKEQFDRVEGLLKTAKTDVELWNVLESEVFSVIRRLDLDNIQDTGKQGKVEKNTVGKGIGSEENNLSEMAIIGPNYPSFLLIAMRQLRLEFPSSTLSLALLPAIKSLGRGSFALGASTELYNELIATAWLTYSDFQGIDDLLQEMENGGVDFDANTLDLLDSINQGSGAMSSRLGSGTRTILEMDRFKRGIAKLRRWRAAIRGRMEAEAIRQVKEREEPPI